uniref:Decaprenyl diphosphate synthase subunit 1 n=1 Tax=Equus caballus TaxID=9796 RepID=A0A9L0T929_HORSE
MKRESEAVLAGDLILSAASIALARIGNTTVISILTQVIEDLVRGEFLQLGSKENENERFAHYLEKTFKKTASLIANSCKAFPEMNAMIMRRFSLPGDVDRARQYVLQSDGVQQTTYLAQRYCHEAVREISKLRPSPERDALIQLSEIVLTRDK